MKFQELKVDRLKRELSKLELPRTGTKAELQRRLLEEFQQRGINMDTYEFNDEEKLEVHAPTQASNMNIDSLLDAIMTKMEIQHQAFLAEVEETFRVLNQELLAGVEEIFGAQNQALLAVVKGTSEAQNQVVMAEVAERSKSQNPALLAEVKETSEAQNQVWETSREVKATNEKLAEISAILGERVEGTETRVTDLEAAVDERINEIEEKVNSLQCQPGGSVRVVPQIASKINTPCFDGSIPLPAFKQQYETVARWNARYNMRKAEVVEDRGYITNRLKEVVEQLLAERQLKANAGIKSLNCRISGHLQADCRAPRKKPRQLHHRITVDWRTMNNHRKRRRLKL